MHSSITAHIVGDYLIDEATLTWGPNLEMFKWRLGNPEVKDRWAGAWGGADGWVQMGGWTGGGCVWAGHGLGWVGGGEPSLSPHSFGSSV